MGFQRDICREDVSVKAEGAERLCGGRWGGPPGGQCQRNGRGRNEVGMG